jgi:serine/threonine protein kinase
MKPNTILANRYQIHEQLSQKNGRRTFLAQDLQSQDLAIVKVLRFDADFEWDDHKLFEREASILQNLDHQRIPQYLDYFDVDEPDCRGFALVQTYIHAPSLETLVKAGRRFSEAEVVELADRVLSILTYLHGQIPPVIHRDIKPSNILLSDWSVNNMGDVYLVDFGSVQTAASKNDGTITIVGSAGYIPLEQFSGQTVTASDLYSLGMTIIYLLTGVHPAELTQVNGQVKFSAEISNRLRRWVEKMTQPYLDKRFDSAKLAQTALASEDGSYGDFAHLKPVNTQVQLYRDRDKIEIKFPNSSMNFVEMIVPLLGFLWVIFVPFYFWNGLAILLAFGFLVLICSQISLKLYPIKVISIDRKNKNTIVGKSRRKSSKIKWDKSSSTHACEIIVYNPGYAFDKYLDSDGQAIKRGEVKVSPELQLCCGARQESIKDLSQAELWWLGKEISDFLNLELQVIYPTPQLPSESSGCGGGC